MSIRFTGKAGSGITRRLSTLLALLGIVASVAACGDDSSSGDGSAEGGATTVRLGVFPNLTHAPGLIGIEEGLLEDALGEGVDLEVSFFNAGGEAAQALLAGAIDLTYIGPNPAINAFAQSEGEAVRLVAGSTSGGAFLVVRDGIDAPDDLAGTVLASPQPIGNTQDVAMRAWLADEGYQTDETGGGDVEIRSMANADVLSGFEQGTLDGAWVPEPWATRLVDEEGGHVLIDERDLWPDGRYVTTHILVATSFLEGRPDLVHGFLEGHLAALDLIEDDPTAAQSTVADVIEEQTGARLADDVIDTAWAHLEFTSDPVASSLTTSADDAVGVGLLEPVDLDGIYDLTILNELLDERGEPQVTEQ
jgi:NitT/TauT family transport system substrate-binding protein